jgi:hypothetical protein
MCPFLFLFSFGCFSSVYLYVFASRHCVLCIQYSSRFLFAFQQLPACTVRTIIRRKYSVLYIVYASNVRTDAVGSRSCCRFCVVRVDGGFAGVTFRSALHWLAWAAGDGSVRTWQEKICCGSRDRDGGRPTYVGVRGTTRPGGATRDPRLLRRRRDETRRRKLARQRQDVRQG